MPSNDLSDPTPRQSANGDPGPDEGGPTPAAPAGAIAVDKSSDDDIDSTLLPFVVIYRNDAPDRDDGSIFLMLPRSMGEIDERREFVVVRMDHSGNVLESRCTCRKEVEPCRHLLKASVEYVVLRLPSTVR